MPQSKILSQDYFHVEELDVFYVRKFKIIKNHLSYTISGKK